MKKLSVVWVWGGKGNELFWLKYSYQCKCFRIISIPPETEDSDEK